MSERSIKNDDARPDVDVMLRDFFQSEMPDPWPTLTVPETTRPRRGLSFWAGSYGRLALAASVALLLAGYIALSGYLPQPQTDPAFQQGHHIGKGHQRGPAPQVNPDDQ